MSAALQIPFIILFPLHNSIQLMKYPYVCTCMYVLYMYVPPCTYKKFLNHIIFQLTHYSIIHISVQYSWGETVVKRKIIVVYLNIILSKLHTYIHTWIVNFFSFLSLFSLFFFSSFLCGFSLIQFNILMFNSRRILIFFYRMVILYI